MMAMDTKEVERAKALRWWGSRLGRRLGPLDPKLLRRHRSNFALIRVNLAE